MALTSQQIKDYIESVQYDPVAIAQTAGKFNVSMDDIASAMGYDTGQVIDYLKTGLQKVGMDVYFEGGEQQGEAGSTYTPMTISSFSKPVEGSKQKYEAFSPDMQSRGIIDNGSLTSQILSDLSPIITMAVPFAGAELASLLGVSTATGTALVNAGMQVAQGADGASVLKGLVSSQLSQAISPVVANELQDIVSDPTTSKLITNIGTSVVNSALSGNTSNLGKTIVGSAVDTLVGDQTGNSTLGNVLGSAVTGGGQGAANTLAGIVGSSGSTAPTIDTYPETDDDLISILAGKPSNSSITAPTDTQSLLDILGDSSNQIISDAPFVAQPTTQTTQTTQTTPDYSGQTFGSAFSAARANGESVFNWNGKAYNTNLAPTDTGTTTQTNTTKTTSPPVSDVYPDIKGTVADKANTTQTTPSNLGPYINYKNAFGMTPQMGDINQVADPRTLAFTKGFIGDDSASKGFSALHPDISGIQNAGDVGTYSGYAAQLAPIISSMAKGLGSGVKTLGSAADESFASLLNRNANKDYMAANLDQYATEPARFGPNSPVWSSFVDDAAKNSGTTSAELNQLLQKANDAAKSGNAAESYRIMQNDPYTRNLMLDFSKNIGFQEVGPAKATRSFFAGPDVNPLAQYQTNPGSYPQFMTNLKGEFVSNQNYRQPYGWGLPSALERAQTPTLGHGWYNDVKSQPRPERMIGEKADGGLISSNNMDELLKIING